MIDETCLDYCRMVDGIKIWSNMYLEDDEIRNYIARWQNRGKTPLASLLLHVVDDEVEIQARFEVIPFERIRRVTGYLAGDVRQFNDAKQAEERERVKHKI